MNLLKYLCQKFVADYDEGQITLIKTIDRLSVSFQDTSCIYSLSNSPQLNYWFNVVFLISLNNTHYSSLIEEAISSAYPIENVNLVCSLMPVVDVTKIIITVETIQLSTAPLTV